MRVIIGAFLMIGCIFLIVERSFAGTALLSWNPPTQNMDGSTIDDLAGYRIYWGVSSGAYTNSVDVSMCAGCPAPNGTEIEFECVSGFSPDTVYFFAVTAYDTSGNESPFSNEVTKLMPAASIPLGNINTTGTGSASRVDGYDLIEVQKSFGTGIMGSVCNDAEYVIWIGIHEKADLNGDGKVDGSDLTILLGNFGKSQ